jgi:hypothetical protein
MSALASSGHDRILVVVAIMRSDCVLVDWVIAETSAMAGQWMRRGLAPIVLAVVMVIAAPMQTRAQRADDLAALNKRISELQSAGKFGEAIPLAEKSLETRHREPTPSTTDFRPLQSYSNGRSRPRSGRASSAGRQFHEGERRVDLALEYLGPGRSGPQD